MISVDIVFCTLRVKRDAPCSALPISRFALKQIASRSVTAIRIPQLRCFMLISVDITRYALKRAAPCFALPHPSRQFAFRSFTASCSFPWTSFFVRFALKQIASRSVTAIRIPQPRCFMLISVDIIKDRNINCAST